ncbi:4Fe-4S ferredoxin [Clostridia bacterium]|nr:4Fe-4S ferredoxin [Clostridia bacterium]
MEKNIIYFFSGTGNSFDVAKRLAESMGNTELLNLANATEIAPLEEYRRIGLVFPVYGFTMPNMVKRFIERLPAIDGAYCFCVVTMGAFALGAMSRVSELCVKRGIDLRYITNVYMLENYILFSRVPSDKLIAKHLANSVKRVARITSDVLSCTEKRAKKPITYWCVQGAAEKESAKWPLTAKEFVVSPDCVKCGKCVNVCPAHNVSLEIGSIAFGERCECCLACVHVCPKQAINYGVKTVGKKRYINPNIKIEDLRKL